MSRFIITLTELSRASPVRAATITTRNVYTGRVSRMRLWSWFLMSHSTSGARGCGWASRFKDALADREPSEFGRGAQSELRLDLGGVVRNGFRTKRKPSADCEARLARGE